jgi:thiol-disulfide isomerase/thioredoxin
MPVSDMKLLTRQDLFEALVNNKGLLIIKLGAEWCGPCRKIDFIVHENFNKMPLNATCVIVDIDESIDLYAFFKTKKMVTGIPSVLAYEEGNMQFAPDEVHIGSDKVGLQMFFKRCLEICES